MDCVCKSIQRRAQWEISSCATTHMCNLKVINVVNVKDDHRQLSSDFIAYKLLIPSRHSQLLRLRVSHIWCLHSSVTR
jgi:hypothetical protein